MNSLNKVVLWSVFTLTIVVTSLYYRTLSHDDLIIAAELSAFVLGFVFLTYGYAINCSLLVAIHWYTKGYIDIAAMVSLLSFIVSICLLFYATGK
ncbi:hypothetical protein TOTORO_01160 [Serratia phage vB_SmaS-Totoro]|nr:hypothetical protein TOTORO_01160 [Serratia phage vB_SmaS-Totoro]